MNFSNTLLNCSRPAPEDDGRVFSCSVCGGDDETTCECAEQRFQAEVARTCPPLGQAVRS